MFTHQILPTFSLLTVAVIWVLQINYCFCMTSEYSNNGSRAGLFNPAIATWYGSPTGAGSTGGACGFGDDVVHVPYYGLISAGNKDLFKFGKGCGVCYQVKCTQNPACWGVPVTVTITDECPGCNSDVIHFELSGKAFGSLAKPGRADILRNAGIINIHYRRVKCHYNASITFKIDDGSNPNYLAFAVEYVSGDGDIGSVELLPSHLKTWIPMQQLWGVTWKTLLPNGTKGPFSVRLTTNESKRLVARDVILLVGLQGNAMHPMLISKESKHDEIDGQTL